ncbi:MAG: hypothetical protein MPW16_15820 [Candidatus Manganitrophus sp.]|nr:MAG: hypothetical protein MPW16_15820 [Candidatus Manganitrophus sp.]
MRDFSAKVGQSLAPSSCMIFDLPAEHTSHFIDLLDRQFLGLDRTGFTDRHRAGRGM